PLVDEPETDLLVWTTTPWTLPSNQFAAVHPNLEYVQVKVGDEPRQAIVAAALAETIASKVGHELTVVKTIQGEQLIGRRYVPPFDFYYGRQGATQGKLKSGSEQHCAWRVVAADFVTTDSGTGVV